MQKTKAFLSSASGGKAAAPKAPPRRRPAAPPSTTTQTTTAPATNADATTIAPPSPATTQDAPTPAIETQKEAAPTQPDLTPAQTEREQPVEPVIERSQPQQPSSTVVEKPSAAQSIESTVERSQPEQPSEPIVEQPEPEPRSALIVEKSQQKEPVPTKPATKSTLAVEAQVLPTPPVTQPIEPNPQPTPEPAQATRPSELRSDAAATSDNGFTTVTAEQQQAVGTAPAVDSQPISQPEPNIVQEEQAIGNARPAPKATPVPKGKNKRVRIEAPASSAPRATKKAKKSSARSNATVQAEINQDTLPTPTTSFTPANADQIQRARGPNEAPKTKKAAPKAAAKPRKSPAKAKSAATIVNSDDEDEALQVTESAVESAAESATDTSRGKMIRRRKRATNFPEATPVESSTDIVEVYESDRPTPVKRKRAPKKVTQNVATADTGPEQPQDTLQGEQPQDPVGKEQPAPKKRKRASKKADPQPATTDAGPEQNPETTEMQADQQPAPKKRKRAPKKAAAKPAAADVESDQPQENQPEEQTLEELEEDLEAHEIDPKSLSMWDLSYDSHHGKKSAMGKEMEQIDWDEVAKKRRAEENVKAVAGGQKDVIQSVEGTENAATSQDGEGRQSQPPAPAQDGVEFQLNEYGEVVTNTQSLAVDPAAEARRLAEAAPVEEINDLTVTINRTTWANNRRRDTADQVPAWKWKSDPWSEEETDRFYQAISMWGTDFMTISLMFPPKTRRMIKQKFVREERLDPQRINDAMCGKDTSTMNLKSFCEWTGKDPALYTKFEGLEHAQREISESMKDRQEALANTIEQEATLAAEEEAEKKKQKKKEGKKSRKKAPAGGTMGGFGGGGGPEEEEVAAD